MACSSAAYDPEEDKALIALKKQLMDRQEHYLKEMKSKQQEY